jgi:plastocyanin
MRTLFITVAAALALTALGSATAANQTVTITRTGFVPADVTINVGETVTWRNTDSNSHQVVFDRAPCNLTISAGQSASCTFRSGGRFSYQDRSQQPRLRGTVTVNGPRASVTLAAPRTTATFAAPVTLSGVVSSQAAGESVTINAQECGKTSFTRLGSATTTASGNWTFTVRPKINTVYQSRWRTNESSAVTLKVRPAIRLTRVGQRFTARVTAAQSFTGKTIALQRYRAAVRRWATLKRVTLGASTTPTAGTFVTTAKFRSRIRSGWRLRVLLPQAQAGTCYLAAPSNTLRVR